MPTISPKQPLDRLPAVGSKQTDYLDDGVHRVPGLVLRVSPTGKRTWVIVARRPGKKNPSRLLLGDLRELTLTDARQSALAFKAQLRDGVDPIAERQRRRDAAKSESAQGFAKMAELFISRHVKRNLRPKTQSDYTRIVNKVLVPEWGTRDASLVGKADVLELIDREEDRAPYSARLTFAVMRKLFGFAVQRGLVDANPCDGLSGPAVSKARDRWLGDDEIALFWAATGDRVSTFYPAYRFLLVTAQRLNEVSGMTWDEVDLDRRVWTIPAARAKNGKAHEVDLTALAMAILNSQPRFGRFVFGSGDTPLSGWSKAKQALDADMLRLGGSIPPWRNHDLRRTSASHMASLGFAPHVIERVINHVSGSTGGLVAVYQHHDHRSERRAALDAWSGKIKSLVRAEKMEAAQ